MTDDFPIWAGGEFHRAGEPVLQATDLGFTLGMAVFDSLVCSRGCLLFAERHLERLEAGARELRLPWPPPETAHARMSGLQLLDTYASEAARLRPALAQAEFIVRTTYTGGAPGSGPRLLMTGRDVVPPPAEGVVVSLARDAKPSEPDAVESVKSTSRIRNVLAREDAQAAGAWDALLCSTAGDVIEGTICNVFAVLGDVLVTPPVARGCLPGITRELLLEDLIRDPVPGLPVRETRIEIAQLEQASEVFLTNSSGRLIPVREVLGLSTTLRGTAGPRWQGLSERFDKIEAQYRASRP